MYIEQSAVEEGLVPERRQVLVMKVVLHGVEKLLVGQFHSVHDRPLVKPSARIAENMSDL